ncbi:MAG: hypothetical protein KGM47_18885 [Acidobacteriota bacterium]|nr:hypothetical protein [Acidobacteriota bacterium]
MDVEKTMQFILEMQAKHEVAAQRHDEQIAKHDQQLALLEKSVAAVTDLVGRLAQAELRLVDRINELRDAQAGTDYKLNALIDTVDKLARRNGGASK